MSKKNTNRHNILYFSSFGSMKGGGQRSLFYLVRGLNKNIFNPIVVCPEEGELVNKLKETGIETVVMPSRRFRHLSIRFIIKLLRLFKEKNIAIVHTDAPAETFYAGVAARLLGIPLVWHIRVSNGNKVINSLLSYLCAKLILVAKSLESRFPYLNSNKLVPIINGINVEEFDAFSRTDIRKEIGTDKDTVVIGCIGRIEEMKGQEYLVRAIDIVSRERRDFRVLLIGEADETYYKDIMALMDSLNITMLFSYLGYRTDTAGIIKDVDILVSSSFQEGLSRVILEAMAAGKPVIATDVGGTGEAVIDGINGYIIHPGNYNALAETILNLLSSPEKRKEMGTQGRQRVEHLFSLTDNINKTEQLYLSILKNAN
ncbi:MAG: glycosyltransferase [Deltaproteobacteria bacterium]|nr:glycosyltransferase [Deltaproteobacteria bacterium]